MKFIKLIVMFAVIILLLIFVVQNVGQQVTLKFFAAANTFTTEMIMVVLIAGVIGFLIGLLMAGLEIFSAKNKLRVLAAEYKKLRDELDQLRNQNIQDTLDTES